MGKFIEVLIFVIMGVVLLWFGYTFYAKLSTSTWGWSFKRQKGIKPKGEGTPGDPHTCPVCSAKLEPGEMVSSAAFPSLNGGQDRFMHIRGCIYCLFGDRDRVCPVCGTILEGNEILISRLYERPGRRAHVHVIGCSHCKGPHLDQHL